MIGLKLPSLLMGRMRRHRVVGQRADFCEFCLCVCRHWVVAFETSRTVLLVPTDYEDVKRESRCEICRSQFEMDFRTTFHRNTNPEPIDHLIHLTNPRILDVARNETGKMIERTSGTEEIKKNRIRNFFNRHELELRQQYRSLVPFAVIASFQAVIIGLILSAFAPIWIAASLSGSLFLLVILSYFIILRNRVFRRFEGAIHRLMSVASLSESEIEKVIEHYQKKCPGSANLFQQQLVRAYPDRLFQSGEDYVALVAES